MFDSKDDKVGRLEKDIREMERKVEQNLQRMNETVKSLNDIILRLQRENVQLRSERDFLVERHKKMLKRVPVPDLAFEINEKLVKPASGKIKENVDFVQLLAKEGFVELKEQKEKPAKKNPIDELKDTIIDVSSRSHGKTIDSLFEMISKTGKIRADDAARKLGVHEVQIEEWAKILEEHEMASVKKTLGKIEISKI
ncbi:MAG: coiled-coil [archaeon GW2011_AR5]|nr:MAG: coiled-coil [archaeon GW2011_AR5]